MMTMHGFRTFLTVVCLSITLHSFAVKVETRYSTIIPTAGSNIPVGFFQSDVYTHIQNPCPVLNPPAVPPLVNMEEMQSRVVLRFDHDQTMYVPGAVQATVDVQCVLFLWDGSNISNTVVNKQLIVDYDPNGGYNDKDIWAPNMGSSFEVLAMDVTIINVVTTPFGSAMNLSLDVEFDESWYTLMSTTTVLNPMASYNATYNSLDISLGKDVCPAYEYYDLEWTWIDDYNASGGSIPAGSILMPTDFFRHNATRVQLVNSDPNAMTIDYSIPLQYDRGWIVYRIRGVGKDITGNLDVNISTEWSSNTLLGSTLSAFPHRYQVTGHETAFNWQRSTQFAEEGKHKEVVSYADGTNRTRQEVTKVNSNPELTLVSETYYDRVGREVIKVLPVPVDDELIQFYSNFSLVGSSPHNMSWEDFDKDVFGSNCLNPALSPPLLTTAGASQYYSSANPLAQDLETHRDYIPDAVGYPYVHTEFTPDKTGKVRKQSAPGINHRLGSGHETSFYYGVPFQPELDFLFGYEVGYASHYLKDMQVDANGQVSVEYKDDEGKVIATMLAGSNPAQLDPVPGSATEITVDLLNKGLPTANSGKANKRTLDGMSNYLQQEVLVMGQDALSFYYRVDPMVYTEVCTTATNDFCRNCVFDVELSLMDECGNEYLWNSSQSTTAHVGPTNYNILVDDDCGTPLSGYTETIVTNDGAATPSIVDMPIGKYTVKKSLTLNKDALDAYSDDYIQYMIDNECFADLDAYIELAKAELDYDCADNCATCLEKLNLHYYGVASPTGGSSMDPITNVDPVLTYDDYLSLKEECEYHCTSANPRCESAYEAMLNDMSPNGQYGKVTEVAQAVAGTIFGAGPIDPAIIATFPLSIYNPGNILPRDYDHWYNTPGLHPTWRKPYNPGIVPSSLEYEYLDENGNKDYVEVLDLGGGNYEPAIIGSPVTLSNGHLGIEPYKLSNVEDFIFRFKPSWAQSLVVYHPEYEYYEMCECLQESHDFDEELIEMKFINPGGALARFGAGSLANLLTGTTEGDPFFNGTISACPSGSSIPLPSAAFMQHLMDNYISMGGTTYSIYEVAYITYENPTFNYGAGSAFPNCTSPGTIPSVSNFGATGLVHEHNWEIFKGLYLSLKQALQDQYSARVAIKEQCYNGCIGNDYFNPFDHDFASMAITHPNASAFNTLWGASFLNKEYWNFMQPCSRYTEILYKDKVPRFPSQAYMTGYNSSFGNQCATSYSGANGYISPVCAERNQEILDEQKKIAEIKFYEDCGACPIQRHFETFMTEIAEKNILTSGGSPTQLSCYAANGAGGHVESWTPALELACSLALGTSSPLYYHFGSTTATSYSAFIDVLTLSLAPVPITLTSSSGATINWAEVFEICCFKNVTWDAVNNRSEFTALVRAQPATGDPVEYKVEGTIGGVDLTSCTMEKVCRPSKEAHQLANLLNELRSNSSLTSTNVDLADPGGDYFVHVAGDLQNAFGPNHTYWSGAFTGGNHLIGTITDGASSTGCSFDIDFNQPILDGYALGDLLKIVRIIPSMAMGVDYEVHVVFQSGTSQDSYTLLGTSDCLDPGVCSNSNEWETISTTNNQLYIPKNCEPNSYALDVLAFLQAQMASTGNFPVVWANFIAGPYTINLHFELPPYSIYQITDIVEVLSVEPNFANLKELFVFVKMGDGSVVKLTTTTSCGIIGWYLNYNCGPEWGTCTFNVALETSQPDCIEPIYLGPSDPPTKWKTFNRLSEGMAITTQAADPSLYGGGGSHLSPYAVWWWRLHEPEAHGASPMNAPTNWGTQVGAHHQWTVDSLGHVFGIAIDKEASGPNIYVTNSMMYMGENDPFQCGGQVKPLLTGYGPAGTIYKLDGVTGNPSILASLPQAPFTNQSYPNAGTQPGPGLGNICYDEDHDQLFVSNFHDGRIYRIDPSTGNTLSVFDHKQLWSGVAIEIEPERPFGVGYRDGVLYYGIWADTTGASTVYSVDIKSNGDFDALTNGTGVRYLPINHYEFTIPGIKTFSSLPTGTLGQAPVSDITFMEDDLMLISTRSDAYNSYMTGGVYLAQRVGSSWTVSNVHYPVGDDYSHALGGGGVAYSHRDQLVWSHGYLSYNGTGMYNAGVIAYNVSGYAGTLPISGAINQDIYYSRVDRFSIDNCYASGAHKSPFEIGDVEIFSTECKGDTLLCCIPPSIYTMELVENDCEAYLDEIAVANGTAAYNAFIEEERAKFRLDYMEHCLDVYEQFDMTYDYHEYQTTLYYYDQAGNLVQTISPEGQNSGITINSSSSINAVMADRISHTRTSNSETQHDFRTTYRYNSLNQVVAESMPDKEGFQNFSVSSPSTGVPGSIDLNTNANFSGQHSIASGINSSNNKIGYLAYTNNGGSSWAEGKYHNMPDVLDIMYTGGSDLIAAGEAGNVFRSTDNGATWYIDQSEIDYGTSDFVAFDGGLSAGTYYQRNNDVFNRTSGTVATSVNGETADLTSICSGCELQDVLATSGGNKAGTAVEGDNSRMYTYDGSDWSEASRVIAPAMNVVVYDGNGDYYAAGENGTLLHLIGSDWLEVANNTYYDFVDMYLYNDGTSTVGCAILEVGTQQKLFSTDDGGRTWTLIPSIDNTTMSDFVDIHFYDDEEGYAVTEGGVIVETYNGGLSWSIHSTISTSYNISAITGTSSIIFVGTDDGRISGLASGAFVFNSSIVASEVTGIAFVPTSTLNEYEVALTFADGKLRYSSSFNALSATGSFGGSISNAVEMKKSGADLYMIDNSGIVNKSTDHGATWASASSSLIGTMSAIGLGGSNPTVVTSNGYLYHLDISLFPTVGTINAATSSTFQPVRIQSLIHHSGATLYAVGNDGTILYSTDHGDNWNVQPTKTNKNLHGLATDGSSNIIAVGNDGQAMHWNSSASIYMPSTTGVTDDLFTIVYNSSASAFYAAGENGRVMKYGSSWSTESVPSSTESFLVGTNMSGASLVFAGTNGMTIRLVSGTWSLHQVHPPAIYDLGIRNASIGVAVGANGYVFRTSNAGQDWTLNDLNRPDFKAVDFADGPEGVIVGNGNKAMFTTDGGLQWNEVGSTATSSGLSDVQMLDEDHFIAVNANSSISTTPSLAFERVEATATGLGNFSTATWTVENVGSSCATSDAISAIDFINSEEGFAVGEDGMILNSLDGGDNWTYTVVSACTTFTEQSPLTGPIDIQSVFMQDPLNAYILMDDGDYLLKTTDGGDSWDVVNLGSSGAVSGGNSITLVEDGELQVVGNGALIANVYFDPNGAFFSSKFYYDEVGRLVASQNSEQHDQNPNKYSYSLYDAQSRIVESGQVSTGSPIQGIIASGQVPYSAFEAWVMAGTRDQVTHTFYDDVVYPGLSITQDNLRSRVVSVTTEANDDGDPATYDNAIHYSYDIHGNVNAMANDIPKLAYAGQQFYTVRYQYDLISGNVKQVSYQKGFRDQFYHKYEYDADNRITKAFTSRDAHVWDEDANYYYYAHGPMSRQEIGELHVQGLDYVYTIQGWLKGVNSANLLRDTDPGKDGSLGYAGMGTVNRQLFAKDVMGFILGYYNSAAGQDYQPISGVAWEPMGSAEIYNGTAAGGLYNGNIGTTTNAIQSWVGITDNQSYTANQPYSPMGKGYRYDQLNRIVSSESYELFNTDRSVNTWNPGSATNKFKTQYEYHPDGDFYKLRRWGDALGASPDMDEFEYFYEGSTKVNHRLEYVTDVVAAGVYPSDIDNQAANNFEYDKIGNLIKDASENILVITWRNDGKIAKIKTANDMDDLEFLYNPNGERIAKISKPKSGATIDPENTWVYTWYARDAQGNVMATYHTKTNAVGPDWDTELHLQESMFYGSDRLGVSTLPTSEALITIGTFNSTGFNSTEGNFEGLSLMGTNPMPIPYNDVYSHYMGEKAYELKNHLGNVLLTISDRRMVNDFDYVYDPTLNGNNYIQNGALGANGFINPAGGPPGAGYDYLTMPGMGQNTTCLAVLTTAQDYYPFGSMMPGRQVSSDGYRYGFNGQEKDDEIKGIGNSYDFGARIYDPRLGRWLSLDPISSKFPSKSPFSFVGNSPLVCIDPDGRDIYFVNMGKTDVDPEISKANFELVLAMLNSTKDGAMMIQKYIDNPDEDIYIAFGATNKPNSLGETIPFKGEISGDKANPKTVDIGGKDHIVETEYKKFNISFGSLVIDQNKVNNFVILNAKIEDIGKSRLEWLDVFPLKKAAKVLAHEIGAHIDVPWGLTEEEEHELWGQEHYTIALDIGKGKAASINGQLNKLKLKDVNKNALKLKNTPQRGVYKVGKN